jgi:3-dehydroquinate synthase
VSSLSFTIAGATTIVEFLPPPLAPAADLVVADTTTARLLGNGTRALIELPCGEKAKIWESVSAILERCAALELGRDSTLAGVGGGVVCDVAAFAASLYMRGCGLILAPTTLLAMVDASLGGKTGIDFLGYKNLVGTFYPASRIIICTDVLRGLPEREYRSGLAEVIKSAVIGDAALFSLLEEKKAAVLSRDPAVIEEMIRRSLSVKGRIVEEDPRESGKRAFLNLGHTFGHALESATGFSQWTHGEAVAWGIGRALASGVRLGITDRAFAGRVRDLLRSYGYRLEAGVGIEDLSAAILRDKKRKAGKTRIVLAAGMEAMLVREVSQAELGDALSADVV